MADEWDLKLSGVEQTLEKVYILNDKLNTHVGTYEFAQEVRDMAKDIVPVSTEQTRPGGPHGDLQDSIRAWKTTEGATVTAGGVAKSGHFVNYAPYVEYGTYKMAAQPYMRPAIELAKLTQTIFNALQSMIKAIF